MLFWGDRLKVGKQNRKKERGKPAWVSRTWKRGKSGAKIRLLTVRSPTAEVKDETVTISHLVKKKKKEQLKTSGDQEERKGRGGGCSELGYAPKREKKCSLEAKRAQYPPRKKSPLKKQGTVKSVTKKDETILHCLMTGIRRIACWAKGGGERMIWWG